ncbi:hypothetical protein M409DRAFT_63922 [Zasmidium cellare ATCC 36951]|uniref:Carboxylesterase type B domain-containing protein n=1 Tax=Zasmidium cellare ATCC 36951 TaxID=1080233 RepID=A0A6A6CX91_ZASCE|nr:uncharacterized protein M409DRAFT_63922 [Zasmidium cellare ATCC 36951]KAF2170858.1 hypothetical protein M409DRAFT_63922 [Zasmidium cellare ATCC 36951]
MSRHKVLTAALFHLAQPANVTFKGSSSGKVESFLNIKFGSDTSDQARFAPPRSYTYQPNSFYDVNKPGAACPQQKVPLGGIPLFDNVTNISEDCLTLRVDRPVGTTQDAKLPVMVYIYGGGDTVGQIYDSAYDPTNLVSSAAEKGFPVLYAAMNYRVGIFGFAASPALNASNSLNVGLLDQRLALDWFQENIFAFGGDPNRVTIFGESDGATNVGLHITAFGGDVERPPFQRAIMQSGAPTADSIAGNTSAVNTAAVIRLTNCTAATSEEELACLRALPLSSLLNTTVMYEFSAAQLGLDVYIPTSPSPFIPDSPSRLLNSGQFAHNIDIVTGWDENDGSFFTPTTIKTDQDVAAFLVSSIGLANSSVDQALRLYPVTEFEQDASSNISTQYFRASQMSRDSEHTCPSLLMVQANSRFSRCSTANYLFALNQTVFTPILRAENASYYGVPHFSDIPFVFNQASTRYAEVSSSSDDTISSLMSGSWAAFADRGRVSGVNGTLPDWPGKEQRCCPREEAANVRVIGGPNSGLRSVNSYEHLTRRCEFWNSPAVAEQIKV